LDRRLSFTEIRRPAFIKAWEQDRLRKSPVHSGVHALRPNNNVLPTHDMPPHLNITCNNCQFHQDFITRLHREYELSGGTGITVSSQVAFCFECRRVVDAEFLPTEDALRKRIDRIKTGSEDEDIRYINTSREDWISYHESVLRWRIGRASPPRCLECGSVDIRPLTEPNDLGAEAISEIKCPECSNGVLRIRVQGLVSTRENASSIYSPEGDLVRVEESQ